MNRSLLSLTVSLLMQTLFPQDVLTASNPNLLLGAPKASSSYNAAEMALEKDRFNAGFSKFK